MLNKNEIIKLLFLKSLKFLHKKKQGTSIKKKASLCNNIVMIPKAIKNILIIFFFYPEVF